MRIAFLGKGGSGKSTLSAAYALFARQKTPHVLAIDADINSHMGACLGLDEQSIWLGGRREEVSNFLKGDRKDLKDTPFVATTPPSRRSGFVRPRREDPFLQKFGSYMDGITLLTIGSFEETDVGHSCYHGKLNVLEMIYHHLLDDEEDIVIADATAGIDNLGTSLFFAYDINIFIVEPTWKSIKVFLDFKEVAKKFDLHIRALANKVMDAEDEAFLQKHISAEDLIGFIPFSPHVKRFSQGESGSLLNFSEEISPVLDKIEEVRLSAKKDWGRYYDLLLDTHKRNSIMWWNDYFGASVDSQCDPDFSYNSVL